MLASLGRLREVSGVIGSFTCADSGQLLASDMPERYSLAELESTAARLTNLLGTLEDAVHECSSVRLAFAEHQLLLRRYRRGLLCVLARADYDRRALGVIEGLVIEQLLVP
jgi:hypothetical protein